MTKQHTLAVEGVKAVRRPFEVGFPEGGGIVEVTGLNGTGKSTVLDSARAILGAGNALQHSDGIDRGSVTWNGDEARITIAKTTRKTGDVHVSKLEGVDPMRLVDPGIKDPQVADDERIRTLCLLTKAKLSPTQFAELVGGDEALRAVAHHTSFQKENAPEMAAAFKRDFEKASRALAEQAHEQHVIVEAARLDTMDVDFSVEHDEARLAAATENAVRALATAEGKAQEARGRAQRVAEAKAKLDDLARERGGISSVEAKARLEAAQEVKRVKSEERLVAENELTEARRLMNLAQSKVDLARERETSAGRDVDSAQRAVASAVDAESAMDQAKVMAAQDKGDAGPSDQELADLRRSVDAARKRQDRGVAIRIALAKKAAGDAAAERANQLNAAAARMRGAAASCEDLLTDEIQKRAPRGLRVRNGRLVMPTARSAEEIFADRSAGERTRVAVDIAIDAIGEGGILVLSQEAYEGLDPNNRAELDAHLRTRNTWMLAAACSNGPLASAPYKNGSAA